MKTWNVLGLLVLVAASSAPAADGPDKIKTKPKPAVSVGVSFSVEEYDPSKPSRATMTCVVRNDSTVGVRVPVGFDGGYVRIQSGTMSLLKRKQEKDDVKLAWVEPGRQQVIFELPLDDVCCVAEKKDRGWHWNWTRHPAPPLSPVHKNRKSEFVDEA